ncbi:hypothetical protein NYE25_29815 [Paenibacillus sp. FSL E2-8871]|uniref:hypothetical protein n=1 Tax=Paenibacillus sp. FSL E2-8871 TaxID=2975326 RepID=UPI0030F4DB72
MDSNSLPKTFVQEHYINEMNGFGDVKGGKIEGTGQSANNFKWGNPKSTPTYGHTFSEHGAKKNPYQLIVNFHKTGNMKCRTLQE